MNNSILVFDFDGTIADTHRFIVEIHNRLSREFNYMPIQPGDIEQLKDKTSQEIIHLLKVPVLKIPAILSRAKKEFQKEIAFVQPFAGLEAILRQLKIAGQQMGILSSNSAENIHQFLINHNLDIFDFIQSTSMVWSKHTSLKKLMEQYDFSPERILYIGDEIRDITAARRLGVKIAAVAWGYNSLNALQRYRPDFLLNTPEELLQFCLSDD